ncbi:methyltransferase domain-containing protein [Novosphingobium resinovorum]|uniref:class I SAM-dependent methyltransferase n=1 Tax=Novosphingobium TaxID=165696 RepID=UPI00200348EF|nr:MULTISPECIES: methyltransferase domain-containing protein [Novosphingobium]WJM25985.1 methyltransferase domain-containing protein [Novosphingobium resinovorum]
MSFKEFLRSPLGVGSAFPASRCLIRRMLAPIDWNNACWVVEYGPGAGGFTRALLDLLPDQARLVAIDTGKWFIRGLEENLPDERLYPVAGSAAQVRSILSCLGIEQVDCIVSGLPFSTLPPSAARKIMDDSRAVLAPGGHFLAYQMRDAIAPLLRERFAKVETGFEWRNVPPCRLYWATGVL